MRFFPNPTSSIAAEMIRQGFVPSPEEAMEICYLDEAASGTDTAIALGSAAVGVGSASGILTLSGFTLPLLIPLVALGYGAITAWNARVTQRYRESESDFLQEYGSLLAAAEQKLNQGQPASRVAAALDAALRAYNSGDVPQLALSAAPEPSPASIPPAQTATIGVQTQLGAIAVEASPAEEPLDAELEPIEDPAEVSPDARRDLIARLRAECPALLKLVKSHPIRAVGVQRSGKTTLVKKLALLRMILLSGHRVVACTPHYKPNEGYPTVFKIAGITPDKKRDYPAIAREWKNMSDGVESCQEQNKTYVYDEFGIFDKVVDEETIKANLTSALRETMKFGIYPVFILHGETAAFMPGSKGLVTVVINSTVRVETIGEPVPDDIGLETIRPTGKFTVTWLDGTTDEGRIPEWLTEKYLLGLLRKTARETATPTPEPAEPDHRNQTQKPKLDPAPTITGETAPVSTAKQIIAYIQSYPPGNGGVKMRELKRKFRAFPAENVEEFAHRLVKQYPTKFRINKEIVNGGETLKVEALTNTK